MVFCFFPELHEEHEARLVPPKHLHLRTAFKSNFHFLFPRATSGIHPKFTLLDPRPDDSGIQKVKNLEESILDKIKNDSSIKKELDTDMQKNIKEELKHRIMVDMQKDIKKKMAEYISQTLASKIPSSEDDLKNETGAVYQDTVPPFYNPGIVLP